MRGLRNPNARGGLLLCLLFQVSNFTHGAFKITIEPREEECFFVSYPKGPSMLYGDYNQIDDMNPKPLSLVVMDAEKERVMYRSRKGKAADSFRVNLKEGQKASVCLQNGLPSPGRREKNKLDDGKTRVVGFSFAIEPRDEAMELQVQNGRLIASARDLARELGTLKHHQEYVRSREALHREVVEKTFSSLLLWVIFEVIAMIAVAAGQVMYFRRFLEKRRYM